jgi:hypothetical protein
MVLDDQPADEHFRPLRTARRSKLVLAIVIGPLLWIVALAVVAVVVDRTDSIEVGLLITAAAGVTAAVVLAILTRARRREEERYADGA